MTSGPQLAPPSARLARLIFLAATIALGLAGLAVRGYTALATPDILEWDETYYASTTATAAADLGYFPFVQGYPVIPHMGGIGRVVDAYVLAYKAFGPSLLPLRAVSLAASALAVLGIALLTSRLGGRPAGLVAFAVTPSLLVFNGINSIRLDAMAVAFVAWALLVFVRLRPRPTALPQAIVGGLLSVGLNVHLHTAAAAFGVGCVYLADCVNQGPRSAAHPLRRLGAFVAGYAIGATIFLAVTVLPAPGSYFRSAALARLSAVDSDTSLNLTAPMDPAKLAASFLSPAEILPKEFTRYSSMVRGMPWWERILWLVGVPLFLLRGQMSALYPARVLLPGAMGGAGIVLNSSAPVYFAPLLPFFVPALAVLVTGTSARSRPRLVVRPATTVAVVALAVAMTLTLTHRLRVSRDTARTAAVESLPAPAAEVLTRVSTECTLAGPTGLYARYFMAYPRFVGTRRAEVLIGATYAGHSDDLVAYWRTKQPDVVFGPLAPELGQYVSEQKYEPVVRDVWRRPQVSAGCRIRSASPD